MSKTMLQGLKLAHHSVHGAFPPWTSTSWVESDQRADTGRREQVLAWLPKLLVKPLLSLYISIYRTYKALSQRDPNQDSIFAQLCLALLSFAQLCFACACVADDDDPPSSNPLGSYAGFGISIKAGAQARQFDMIWKATDSQSKKYACYYFVFGSNNVMID